MSISCGKRMAFAVSVELQLCACVRMCVRACACASRGRGQGGSWGRVYLEHVVAAQLASLGLAVKPEDPPDA